MAMKHIVASIAEKVLYALFTFYDGTNCPTELTFQAHFGGTSLHYVFGIFCWRCVAVSLIREIDYLVIRVGVYFLWQTRRLWSCTA